MIQNMRYWCFNCEKITLPKPGLKCQFCESDALEEIRDQNNPAQYVPYNVPAQTQPQQMP
jgi:predicted RNA-binding protein with PUA domain